jgi:hypothetical protein
LNFEIPVYCHQCNAVYRSGMVLDETSRINVGPGSAFICPRGHSADLMEGTFDARSGVLRVRDAQGGSVPAWQKIHDLASQALSGEINQDEAIDAISLLAPDLGSLLKVARGKSFLRILAIIMWFIVQINGKSGSESSPIFIQSTQTTIGQIVINEGIASPSPLASGDEGVRRDDRQHSKRKRRRIDGRKKERNDHPHSR